MRLVAWPSTWDKNEGLLPVETQEIDFHANAIELRGLAKFFAEAADRVEKKELEAFELNVDFADSKTKVTTPICVTVHRV